jgi:hypothetical protein
MTTESKIGHLPSTLATWVYLLHVGGRPSADETIRDLCDAIDGAVKDDGALADHGAGLATALEGLLSEGLEAALAGLYGSSVVRGFGADREERLRAVRRYQFCLPLPWLASLVERTPDGDLVTHPVLVESLRDTVTLMDPYPWDAVEEERTLPLWEFVAKWELAGADAWRVN